MYYLRLISRNTFRHRLRSLLTITGIVVAILAFGLLQTVVNAWYAGSEMASATRLVSRNAISLVFPVPLYYRDRIRAVTPADVQRVARTHLTPDKMVILMVGNQSEIDVGDGKHEAGLAALAPGRNVVTLPLRDPMTMKRP